MPTPINSFRHSRSALSFMADELRIALFGLLASSSLPLFLRGRDTISAGPIVNGAHELHVKSLIDHAAGAGYADFLIDIGANIGLTSCQSGDRFTVVHMYEPNPLCCKVLEVNAAIALSTRTVIHPVGLGAEQSTLTLMVPRDNWGGAFIADKQNAYSAEVLAQKDGYSEFDKKNYVAVQVEIKSGQTELAQVFDSLTALGLTSGVIKIDAEGFETVILEAISKSIPPSVQATIVYESWGETNQLESVKKLFGSRAKVLSLRHDNPWKQHWPRWLKLLLLILRGRYMYALSSANGADPAGEMVLLVDRACVPQ